MGLRWKECELFLSCLSLKYISGRIVILMCVMSWCIFFEVWDCMNCGIVIGYVGVIDLIDGVCIMGSYGFFYVIVKDLLIFEYFRMFEKFNNVLLLLSM